MERIDFASLYQFDEIYLIQKEQNLSPEPSKVEEALIETPAVEIPKIQVETAWLVVGVEADQNKIKQILAASPFNFAEHQFTFLEINSFSMGLDELFGLENVQKVVLLGNSFEGFGLPQEPVERSDKKIYYFNRSLESLTDEEKDLKRLFWNQLKKML